MTDGRLVVHIGDHKTGSTSMQIALARGNVTLKSGKLCYPLVNQHYCHNFVAHGFVHSLRARFTPDTSGMKRVATIARKANPTLTVLSAEGFEKARPSKVAEAIDEHFKMSRENLVVYCLVRPHISRLSATLSEYIKCGRSSEDPMRDVWLMRRYWLGFGGRLNRWSNVFGSSFKVSAFKRDEMANGQPLDDLFAKAIGPDMVDVKSQVFENKSLGVEDLMRIHLVQKSLPDLAKWERHTVGWYLARKIAAANEPSNSGTKLTFDQATSAKFRKAYWSDASRIDRKFFADRPVFRDALTEAVDTAPRERLELRPEAWLSPGQLADAEAMKSDVLSLTSKDGWRAKLHKQQYDDVMAAS